jgi:hypothetical protein
LDWVRVRVRGGRAAARALARPGRDHRASVWPASKAEQRANVPSPAGRRARHPGGPCHQTVGPRFAAREPARPAVSGGRGRRGGRWHRPQSHPGSGPSPWRGSSSGLGRGTPRPAPRPARPGRGPPPRLRGPSSCWLGARPRSGGPSSGRRRRIGPDLDAARVVAEDHDRVAGFGVHEQRDEDVVARDRGPAVPSRPVDPASGGVGSDVGVRNGRLEGRQDGRRPDRLGRTRGGG